MATITDDKEEKTTAAIVVTYNRKKLLLECLAKIFAQDSSVASVYIVDNASTDGTASALTDSGFLDEVPSGDGVWVRPPRSEGRPSVNYFLSQRNCGGAWGFYLGLKAAYNDGHNYFWVMDDDTIAEVSTLSALLGALKLVPPSTDVGFLCSKVLWMGTEVHRMNIPAISTFVDNLPFNSYDHLGLFPVSSCSFVSVLITRKALTACGLPIKEFFIWGDDTEYTERIVSHGFKGLYVPASVVRHATAKNHFVDILSDSGDNAWKYLYGIRNNLYLRRRAGNKKFLKAVLKQLLRQNLKIMMQRKNKRLRFMLINTRASVNALFFKPAVTLQWSTEEIDQSTL